MSRFEGMTAEQCRQAANDCRRRADESWERSDTDGFLSQWASGLSAQQYDEQARILEQGGRDRFWGLYVKATGERVAAKQITQPAYNAPWRKVTVWRIRYDWAVKLGGRITIPTGEKSRIQKSLGLEERREWAPAVAYVDGEGTGLSGCASAFVCTRRTGNEWGLDATPEPGEEEAICPGHESLNGPAGISVCCDGSCRSRSSR